MLSIGADQLQGVLEIWHRKKWDKDNKCSLYDLLQTCIAQQNMSKAPQMGTHFNAEQYGVVINKIQEVLFKSVDQYIARKEADIEKHEKNQDKKNDIDRNVYTGSSFGYTAGDKIAAAEKLIEVCTGKEDRNTFFSSVKGKKAMKALNQGELEKVIKQARLGDVLKAPKVR